MSLDQIGALAEDVERAGRRDPVHYRRKNCVKRLAAILNLAFEVIPQDPSSPLYRQGGTLDSDFTHWRAKFFQQ